MKFSLNSFFLSSLLFSHLGCSLVNEPQKTTSEFNTQSLELTCLNTVPERANALFQGKYQGTKSDLQEIDSIWSCLNQGLETFSKYTVGADPNGYRPSELQKFANKYFPSNQQMSVEFALSIFRLKKEVLGGSEDLLTRNEITNLIEKISLFGRMMKSLGPNLGVILRKGPYPEARMKESFRSLRSFSIDFALLLSDSKMPVSFTTLENFIQELETYLGSESSALSALRDHLSLIQSLKLMFVGGQTETIEQTKWEPILKTVSVLYESFLGSGSMTDLIKTLNIELQSDAEHRKAATDQITTLLLQKKKNKQSGTANTFIRLADAWGKLLILNDFIFPGLDGEIALSEVVRNTALRQNFSELVDAFQTQKPYSEFISPFQKIIDQAENATKLRGLKTGLNWSHFFIRVQGYRGLFQNEKDFQTFYKVLEIIQQSQLLLSQNSTTVWSSDEFRAMTTKVKSLLEIWDSQANLGIHEKGSRTLTVLTTRPRPFSIQRSQLGSIIQNVYQFNALLSKPFITVSEAETLDYVKKFFKIKAQLFSPNEDSITFDELRNLTDFYSIYSQQKDWKKSLGDWMRRIEFTPLRPLNIDSLLTTLDQEFQFLAPLRKYGIEIPVLKKAKVLLVGGTEFTLERQQQAALLRLAEQWVSSIPENIQLGMNAKTFALFEDLLKKTLPILPNQSLAWTPFSQILEQTFPRFLEKPIRASSIQQILKGLKYRILQAGKIEASENLDGEMSKAQLQSLIALITRVRGDLEVFERAFQNKAELSQAELLNSSLPQELKVLTQKVPALILNDDLSLRMRTPGRPSPNYTFQDVAWKSLFFRLSEWVIQGFGPLVEPKKFPTDRPEPPQVLSTFDIEQLLRDINDFILDIDFILVKGVPADSASSRTQTMNLFTHSGNGDRQTEVYELTEFLTLALGGSPMNGRVYQLLQRVCFPSARGPREFGLITPACLERTLFSPGEFREIYGNRLPGWNEEFQKLNPTDRTLYIESALTAADARWRSRGGITINELETLIPLPTYIENLFQRMDANQNEVLEFQESFQFFPHFCREIKRLAELSGSCEPNQSPKEIEPVYGHLILRVATPPTRTIPFIWWWREWRKVKYYSNEWHDQYSPKLRRLDLLVILSELAKSGSNPDTFTELKNTGSESSVGVKTSL